MHVCGTKFKYGFNIHDALREVGGHTDFSFSSEKYSFVDEKLNFPSFLMYVYI